MSAEAAIAAFPRRPLRLVETRARKFGRIFFLLLFLAAAVPAVWWTIGAVRETRLYADLEARGVSARVTEATNGECSARRRRTSGGYDTTGCDFDVTYRTAPEHGGRTITTRLHHTGDEDDFRREVRYDPQAPERALLTRELEAGQSWSAYIGPGLGGDDRNIADPPVAAGRAAGARSRRTGARPDPGTDHERRPGNALQHAGGRVRPGRRQDRMRQARPSRPAADAAAAGRRGSGSQWAMALVGQNGRPYLLDEKLAWLDLTDAERQAVYRGIAA